jgi:sugar phosphate isomerase/epimerase
VSYELEAALRLFPILGLLVLTARTFGDGIGCTEFKPLENIMTTKSIVLNLCIGLMILLTTAPVYAEKIPDEYKIRGFALGCQAYTFNRFSVFEAIEKTAQAGGRVIEFYPDQKLSPDQPDVKWDHNASAEIMQKVKDKLAAHHLKAVNYGVVGIPKEEAAARKIFEFAKKLGLYGITTESVESIDTIEKLVKEYDIRVGFHDHPKNPKDPNYKMWDPQYILSVVKDRDRRIGSCADTGHWLTSGVDPVDALKILEGRIISSHLKDRNVLGDPGHHDVPYGTGVGKIKEILDELKRQGFDGNISIEYEYNWENSLPDVTKCIAFVRDYPAAKK